MTKIKAAVTKAENAMEAANNQCVNQVSFLFVVLHSISDSTGVKSLFGTGEHHSKRLQ